MTSGVAELAADEYAWLGRLVGSPSPSTGSPTHRPAWRDSGLTPPQFDALHNLTVSAEVDDSDLVGLGAILGSVDEIEIEAGATATMDAGDYLAFLGNGGTFTGAGSVQVLGADIAQAVEVSDDTIVSGYEVADDAALQDLTVDQAVVYTAADNYTPPQSGGAEFTISDTGAAALFAAEDNGEAERVTLFDAVSVVATGGSALTVAQAKTVSEIAGFDGPASAIDVSDDATEVLGADSAFLNSGFIGAVTATGAIVTEAASLYADTDSVGWTYEVADAEDLSSLTMQQALEVDGSENKSLTDIDIVDDATAVLDNTQELNLTGANTVTANDATVTEAGSLYADTDIGGPTRLPILRT